MTLYEKVLSHNPQHVGALWRRGQLLLACDDPRGIEELSAAARIDSKLEQQVCAAVVGFHRRHGGGYRCAVHLESIRVRTRAVGRAASGDVGCARFDRAYQDVPAVA